MIRVLGFIDLIKRFSEFIEIEVGDLVFNRILDYVNILFHCTHMMLPSWSYNI